METHVHNHSMTHSSSLDFWQGLQKYFSQIDFMPHGHCYLWKPVLVWTHSISDILIGLAYAAISITLYFLVKKIKMPFNGVVLAFGVFIGACGLTHLLEAWNLWHADYWISAWVKVVTAGASVITCIWLIKLHNPILTVVHASKLAEERRLDLESVTRNLEVRVDERTLELTDAIAARDQFLSVASHELKTPLTTMKLQTQMKEKKMVEDKDSIGSDEMAKYIKSMNDQIIRLNNLVDDMLDISHIQRGEFRLSRAQHDICIVIGTVVENMRARVEMKGGLLVLEKCHAVMVEIDKSRIEQVLDNFLINALKYAPGTDINISVVRTNQGTVKVSVRDKGPGISQKVQQVIFEKFERAISANEVSGLGLGLFISKTIISAHAGKIWVESVPGEGATFCFELPVS